MIIYIDSDFKCHASDGEGLTAVEAAFFDGKCAAFIEGYRYVPAGAVWVREDGAAFGGEMIAPWRDYTGLYELQREYEFEQLRAELEDAKAALALFARCGVQTEETP